MVLLMTTRQKEDMAPSGLACSTLLTNDQASLRLPKKLPTPVRTGCGTTSRYAVATGLSTAVSTASLKRNMLRL
jgi:hypothetical protein